jgi:hypothetical protein
VHGPIVGTYQLHRLLPSDQIGHCLHLVVDYKLWIVIISRFEIKVEMQVIGSQSEDSFSFRLTIELRLMSLILSTYSNFIVICVHFLVFVLNNKLCHNLKVPDITSDLILTLISRFLSGWVSSVINKQPHTLLVCLGICDV